MPANNASQPASSSPLASFLDALTAASQGTAANQGTVANQVAAAADAKKAVSKSGDDKNEKKANGDKTASDDASSANSASANTTQPVVPPTANPTHLIANLGLPVVNPQPGQNASSDSTFGSGSGTGASVAVPLQGVTAASAQGQVLASSSGLAVSMMGEAVAQVAAPAMVAAVPTAGATAGSADATSATKVPLKGLTDKDTSTSTDIATDNEPAAAQVPSVAVPVSVPAVPAVNEDKAAAAGISASAPAISQAVATTNGPALPTLPANLPVDGSVLQQPVSQAVDQTANQLANQSVNPSGDQSQPTAATNTMSDTPNVAAKADASTVAVVAAISNATGPMPPAAIASTGKVAGADGKDSSSSKGSAMTDASPAGVSSSDVQTTTTNLFSFQTPLSIQTANANIPPATALVTKQGTDLTVNGVGAKQGVTTKSSGLTGSTKAASKLADSDADASAAPTDSSVVVKTVAAPDHVGQQNGAMQNGNGNAEAQQAVLVGMSAADNATTNATTGAATTASAKPDASGTADSSQAAATTAAVSSTGGATLPSVNSAQLIQTMHQSEMRVGMHSNEFGAISINTSISHQALSAQISTDHSELGRALSMHLPAIEEKLGSAYGLSARVEVRDNGGTAAGNSATQSNGGRQSQSNGSSGGSSSSTLKMAMGDVIPLANTTAVPAVDSARLDIRI